MTSPACKCCDGTGVQVVDAYRCSTFVDGVENSVAYQGVRVV